MGFDEACDTGLGLSLAGSHDNNQDDHDSLPSPPYHHLHRRTNKKKVELKYDDLLPLLTLGRPSDASKAETADFHEELHGQEPESSPSFSNSSSFKRDRDHSGGEDVEAEVLYDQDQESSPRKKLRLSKQQAATLEDSFKQHTTLNPKQKQDLARRLNLQPRQVEVWFQNRRARTKLKQTEADCELLKKCCETLKEENKRLHKELQELKSMKQTAATSPPFYMQFPSATLTMCPSCEKICNGGDHHRHHGSSTSRFLIGSKPAHLILNSFTSTHNPSTAC